jgi:Acetyl-CoA carboxylase, carboxyltransferase component (subunits alpha and beta)
MEITIDDRTDEEIAQAIATAVSEHLGSPVELKDRSGGELAAAGENWDEEAAVVTDREERIREEVEAIMSGGPERGHDKIDDLGKVFVRDRLDMIFDRIEYEDGTFARHTEDDELPADGCSPVSAPSMAARSRSRRTTTP